MINIPTIKDLYTGILADLEAEFQTTIPIFGKVFLRAIAAVQAGKLKLFYLTTAGLQKNIWVDTAERESVGGTLERYGRIKLNRNPFPATQGQYVVAVTGTVGSTVPAQTVFKSNDIAQNPGKLFILDTAYVLVASPDTITLRALEAGLDSRLNVDELLTSTAPINGIDDIASVAAEVIIPQAEEDIEDYREKAIAAYRLEPNGGAAADYRLWSYDAQGVKQAYPYAKPGVANEIDLYIEATLADSTDGKGTPSSAIISDVETVVELDPDTTKPILERGRRPLGVFAVNVMPIVIKTIDITITGFLNLTADKQQIILDALTESIADIRPFIAGADVLTSKNDILGQNNIINIILNAVPGSYFSAVSMEVDGVATPTQTFVFGNIPSLSSVTYV